MEGCKRNVNQLETSRAARGWGGRLPPRPPLRKPPPESRSSIKREGGNHPHTQTEVAERRRIVVAARAAGDPPIEVPRAPAPHESTAVLCLVGRAIALPVVLRPGCRGPLEHIATHIQYTIRA